MFSFACRALAEKERVDGTQVWPALPMSANVAHVAMSSIRALEEIGRHCWRRDVSCEWCILDMVAKKGHHLEPS